MGNDEVTTSVEGGNILGRNFEGCQAAVCQVRKLGNFHLHFWEEAEQCEECPYDAKYRIFCFAELGSRDYNLYHYDMMLSHCTSNWSRRQISNTGREESYGLIYWNIVSAV